MPDRPRLLKSEIPEPLMHSEYLFQIVEAVAFPRSDQRVLPVIVRERLAPIGADGERIIHELDILSAFLGHTFVFDKMTPEAREEMREKLKAEYPEASAWYESNMLKINRMSDVMNALQNLEQHVGRMLQRTMDMLVGPQAEALIVEVNLRWKKVIGLLEGLSPAEHNMLKKDFVANRVAPLVQDVFDATVLSFNDYQLIGTLPGGGISRTMQEIYDTRRAIIEGTAARRASETGTQ